MGVRKLHADAEHARELGLSWADGDRIVVVSNYGNVRGAVWWSVTVRTAGGTITREGVQQGMAVGKVRAFIGQLVCRILWKYGQPEVRHVA